MSGLPLNERHQTCWQESKIHSCSHAICFFSISFEKRQQPQPLVLGKGWECACPGVPSLCPHQLNYCWPSPNLISQPTCMVVLHLHGGQRWPLLLVQPSPAMGIALMDMGLAYRDCHSHFLSECTCPQPLRGAEASYLGSFLPRRDMGEGAQEDWSETVLGQVTFGVHLVPSISSHPSLLGFVLGRQAACTASLKCLHWGRVCIALWGQAPAPALPSTSVFLSVLTAAPPGGKWLGYLLPPHRALKSLIRFQKWARAKNHSELVRNVVGQQEEGAGWVKAREERGVVQRELQRK